MAYPILARILLLIIVCAVLCVTVGSSRADVGTYLNVNDFTGRIPASEERIPVDSYVLAFINFTYTKPDGKEYHISGEKAKYGEGRILNVHGRLVHVTSIVDVDDHTGCSERMAGTRGRPLPDDPWIALIKRGHCTFEKKVYNAWSLRAHGVIVYNEEDSASLDKMKIIGKERNITAVFTYKMFGEIMANIVDEGYNVTVSISEGQRGMKAIPNINKTSVLFVSISFIILMIISLVWLIFYYIQRFRYLQSKDKHSRHLCTVAKRIIAKIPTKNVKNDDKDPDSDCCPICIESYKVTDCVRVLPCKHEFHKNCIDPWLLEHRTCPMCKLDVLKHYGFVFIGSQESILELDLDMEIGSNGMRGDDEDQFSIENEGTSVTTPTFQFQTVLGSGTLIRSSSLESMAAIQREVIPQRSQSSMSCVNCLNDELDSNKITSLFRNLNKDQKSIVKTHNSNFLSVGESKREKESVSLPCTLKKLKIPEACRGSNNCYILKGNAAKQQSSEIGEEYSKAQSLGKPFRQTSEEGLLLSNCKTETIDRMDNDGRLQPGFSGSKCDKRQHNNDIHK